MFGNSQKTTETEHKQDTIYDKHISLTTVLWTQTQFQRIDRTVKAENIRKIGPLLLQDDPTVSY